jgi:hypothetical protein
MMQTFLFHTVRAMDRGANPGLPANGSSGSGCVLLAMFYVRLYRNTWTKSRFAFQFNKIRER